MTVKKPVALYSGADGAGTDSEPPSGLLAAPESLVAADTLAAAEFESLLRLGGRTVG